MQIIDEFITCKMNNVKEMELILSTLKIVGRLIYNNASYLK